MTTAARAWLLAPWCDLAATFLPHDPVSAERVLRDGMATVRRMAEEAL